MAFGFVKGNEYKRELELLIHTHTQIYVNTVIHSTSNFSYNDSLSTLNINSMNSLNLKYFLTQRHEETSPISVIYNVYSYSKRERIGESC